MSIKRIICFFKLHKRGKTYYKKNKTWVIECKRCKYIVQYSSPMARLIGIEIKYGFDGN